MQLKELIPILQQLPEETKVNFISLADYYGLQFVNGQTYLDHNLEDIDGELVLTNPADIEKLKELLK